MAGKKLTPLMEQYFHIRKQYPDALLLFQVGDFYELFFEDAKVASSFLAIALTKRGKYNGDAIPLCGMPVHAVRHYLVKLIKGGFKVAVCNQLAESKPGQVVERGVTQVYTPGTLTDLQMLDEKSASYLLSFYPLDDVWGLAFSELLTAQLFATIVPAGDLRILDAELARFFPDEIIVPPCKESMLIQSFFTQRGFVVSKTPTVDVSGKGNDVVFEPTSKALFEKQFDHKIVTQLSASPALYQTVQQLFVYLQHTQRQSLTHFTTINFYEPHNYLLLDAATQKNLELVKNSQDGGRNNTLLSVLDHARTAMGSRMVKKWLLRPLMKKKGILARQKAVQTLLVDVALLQQLQEALADLADVERIIGRIALQKAQVHDYLGLKHSLIIMPLIKSLIVKHNHVALLAIMHDKMGDFSTLIALLQTSLLDEPGGGRIIKKGFDLELDRLRNLVDHTKEALLSLEQKEVKRTGIPNLKIRYNKVHGYSIEVTKKHLARVPKDYIRQQILANRDRFVTSELIDLERSIMRAQKEIDAVEAAVFERIQQGVKEYLASLRHAVQALAYLDALFSFAKVAYDNQYILPVFHDTHGIIIKEGRHPVVACKLAESFIANDTLLTDEQLLWVLTGPNMGGKSTYLRQVALICIMAQCGSFIPAASAKLPILDRIFTRIGSGDNVAEGKSTFLVEMEETATICSQATKRSLVILDEVGRGTSTFDGLAIAQAVIEYIYQNVQAYCLFATHYHELTTLGEHFSGIVNYHTACKKTDRGMLFLHKIVPGVAPGSFGLEVAKLAHLPNAIIERADQILQALVSQHVESNQQATTVDGGTQQAMLFEAAFKAKISELQRQLKQKEHVVNVIDRLNLEELSPRKALDLLWQLKSE